MDRSVDASTKEHLVNIRGWRGFNNPWMLEDETDVEFSYINLLMNPERYTGYKVGPCLSLVACPAHCLPCCHAPISRGGEVLTSIVDFPKCVGQASCSLHGQAEPGMHRGRMHKYLTSLENVKSVSW